MFTGLIEAVGVIESREETLGGIRFSIFAPFVKELQLGESVAVQGVCLTVVEILESTFVLDVISETLRCTNFGAFNVGQRVNLERALRASDRFGGHIVQGHVDGVGQVERIEAGKKDYQIWIQPHQALLKYIPTKGSITIDGVSLTVSAVQDSMFAGSLIPHTLTHTTIGDLRLGHSVHLEVDLIARYLEKLLP